MLNRWTFSVVCLMLVMFLASGAGPRAGQPAPTLATLEPGGFRSIQQTLNPGT